MTLHEGQPHAWTDFGIADGAAFDLSETGVQFSLWPAARSLQPTLPSRYPHLAGPLWALPALAEHALLSTAETELRGLVARLAADAFNGALVLAAPESRHPDAPGYGLLLFQAGRLGGAVYTAGTKVLGGSAALHVLAQLEAALTLHALPEPVVAGFLGWLLGLQLSSTPDGRGVPGGFSGLELTSEGARYYRAGNAYLQLPYPAGVSADPMALGLFAACQRAPSLALPDESHGWEVRRYGLTLRGRDALNLLTELSMRFRSDFGPTGRRVLEVFRRERSVKAAAETLGLEPGALKDMVERLAQEGFIRIIGEPVRGASPTLHLQPR